MPEEKKPKDRTAAKLPDLKMPDLKLPEMKMPHLPHLPQRAGGTARKGAAGSAPRRQAVVVGGGISGLVSALDLAAAGYAVTVLEAAPVLGGCVGTHEVGGLLLDSGAESFATRSTAVADLAAELGLADRQCAPDPAGAWVQLPDGPVPLPKTGVLGIPADPWAPEVRAALGLPGALRAGMDARLPTSVGTKEEVISVADLVVARMGRAVLERLVAPVVGGVHSADPALLDVDMVAPGLRKGIVEHGSLAAAVAAQRASAKAGAAVGGLVGGMHTLIAALAQQLGRAGVEVRVGHPVTAISRPPAGPGSHGWKVTAGDWTAEPDALVVATDGPTAVRLLRGPIPGLAAFTPQPGPDVRLVTLVLDRPELDVHPRGTGILVAPQTPGILAKALTHATAKWAWLAEETGPGTHVLRLSYGRAGDADTAKSGAATGTAAKSGAATGTAAKSGAATGTAVGKDSIPEADADLLAVALADASQLLGMDLVPEDLLGWDVVRWPGSLPFATLGHRARVAELRAMVRGVPGLLLTGGWLAGNGLAAVVADARSEVSRLVAASRQPDHPLLPG